MPRAGFSLTQTMTAPPAVGPWPGATTSPTTSLEWEKSQQQQMQEALQGLGTLVSQAEAAQFQRQQESDAARSQYLAAAGQAPNLAPSLSMALPYAAAQFSSALSGRPEVGQQAEQSLALNRGMQLQRRSQVLEQLASQTQEAARRAESAGDLTNALKFNTKANLYLKQIEEAHQGLQESRKTAVDQTFDAWRTMYNARADYLSRLVSAGAGQDPKLAARLFALKEQHDTESKALESQLSMTPANKRAGLQSQLDDINNRYTRMVEGALAGESIAPPPPGPAAPAPTAVPAAKGPSLTTRAGRFLFRSEEMKGANELINREFAAMPTGEVLKALAETDPNSGRKYGDIVASRYGITYQALQKALRMRVGPLRSAH